MKMQAVSEQAIILECLGLEKASKLEVKKLVSKYFQRLRKAYKDCLAVKVRILKLAPEKPNFASENKYLVIITLTVTANEEIYIVRKSEPAAKSESIMFALTAAFAMLYRKLIETQLFI